MIMRKLIHILFPYVWHYFTDTYKNRYHHLIVDSLLSMMIMVLLATNISLLGWLYIFSIPPQVHVDVTLPEVVISGAPLTVTVEYANLNKGVAHFSFVLFSPAGFVSDHTPTNFQRQSLPADTSDQLSFTGYFTGIVDQPYRFVVIYAYDYFGQHYEESREAVLWVDGSSLEVVTTMPSDILNNEPFTWLVEYTNSSDQARVDVCLQLALPEAFALASSSQPLNDQQTIHLEPIPARASGSVSITGTFSNAIGEGNQLLGVTAVERCAAAAYTQSTLSAPIQVLTPRLQVTTRGPSTLNVRDKGTYTMTVTNQGDADLSNINVTTSLNGFFGRVSSITPSSGGSVAGDTITWQIPQLAPGQSSQPSFTVLVNPELREHNVEWSYETVATGIISDIDVRTYANSVSGSTKLNSTLQFAAGQRYTSTTGEQLGYGPYPLMAWEYTAVRVFWDIKDFTNDLSNVTIQTTLPSQVTWTGHSSVSEGTAMTYDPDTRTVTWHSSTVPSFSHPQGASFEVRVLPNSDQIGKKINITNATIFSARDNFTGVVVQRQIAPLPTDQAILP